MIDPCRSTHGCVALGAWPGLGRAHCRVTRLAQHRVASLHLVLMPQVTRAAVTPSSPPSLPPTALLPRCLLLPPSPGSASAMQAAGLNPLMSTTMMVKFAGIANCPVKAVFKASAGCPCTSHAAHAPMPLLEVLLAALLPDRHCCVRLTSYNV